MTAIGGSGGVGGPTGPRATDGAADLDGVTSDAASEQPANLDRLAQLAQPNAAAPASDTSDIDALAADVASGKLTADEALDRLIETTLGPGLDAPERAELRELLGDLIANDPYLGGLIGRM